jgi:hypothetical protein
LCGDNKGDRVDAGGVGVQADILHAGVQLQEGLHLAQAHVLTALQLHKVLLPVDDPDGPVRHHLPDVALENDHKSQQKSARIR